MKKLITLLTIVALATTLSAQTYIVKDSIRVKDDKLTIAVEGLTRMDEKYTQVFDKEKVKTDTMLYLNETRALINYIQKGVDAYSNIFLKVTELNYDKIVTEPYAITTGQTFKFDYFLNGNDSTSIGLIHEWDGLNTRIETLKSDSEIKYLDAVSEFKTIKERQAKLEGFYRQINAQ